MEWESTKVGATRTDSPKRKEARRVDGKEIDRRRSANLCLRCGSSGHF